MGIMADQANTKYIAMDNLYKVEFRVFHRDGSEYQMRKIPLLEGTDNEAREVLTHMGYITEKDDVVIISLTKLSNTSIQAQNYTPENDYRPNSLFYAIGDFLAYSKGRWLVWGGLGVAIWFFIMYSVNNSNTVSSTADIKGTTWQYYGNDLWYKLQINQNGTYDFWRSTPVQGKWENHEKGHYKTYEDRDYRTGEKMIVVDLEQNYSGVTCLTITNGVPSFRPYKYEEGVRVQQTSKNPWN